MKVLIAGCGYVGLTLGIELVRQSHEVYGVRRSRSDEIKAAGIIPVRADIREPETFKALPRGCDWVIHCASASGGGLEEYRRIYVCGTRNLLSWLAETPPRKFIYASSTGVYGQNDGSRVDEASVTAPASETSKVLVEAERLILETAAQTAFPGVIVRIAGIYGPGRGYWLRQFLAGEARIEGDGRRILNMIHRDDVVGGIIAALEWGQSGEVYNLVDDEPVTQLALFEWLAQQLGRSLPPRVPEERATIRPRGSTNKVVCNRRLRLGLGYQLKYPTFREGFAAELTDSRWP